MKKALYDRGEYPRGHSITCKHCGHAFEEHQKPDSVRYPRKVRKGFNSNFSRCVSRGYEPKNRMKWEQRENTYQKKEQREFEMQCLERRAHGEAAWGKYAAGIRHQNYSREHQQLTNKVARASSESQREEAQKDLGNFLKSAKQQASILYVGSGAGPNLAEYD